MSIDIRDLQNSRQLPGQRTAPEGADQASPARGRASNAGSGGAAAESGDKVALSATAQSLKALASAVEASDGIDAAKVDRIRQQIAEGRYHVDAGKLADRMIDLEQSLLG
ncbi:MAG: flagellar biosynthesis anti-sigma factor FlgM [Gammaproteobacteria bacterium]|nr:flagellar biosynthesis anti-sigma factor FlgM [Gammaproteobacteria bacterium]|tara:strand:- start:7719 stop:8048 length:330 start_codon:yes stop_codon:yes gene_type:complete